MPTRRTSSGGIVDRRRDAPVKTTTSSTESRPRTSRRASRASAVIADFVDEIQVKSSGYSAEYRRRHRRRDQRPMTKSGTNALHGNALFNWQGSSLAGNIAVTADRPRRRHEIAEYITYPKDDATRIEPGFSLGGPIVLNKAWFFGAYQPAFTTTDRTVDPVSSANPAALSIFARPRSGRPSS